MTIDEQIAVMDAFRNGFEIHSRPKQMTKVPPSLWCVNTNPTWNWLEIEYRVKPVPKITRQNLIDDIVSCSNNANDHVLAAYHRYVTGSEVYPEDGNFTE